MSFDYDVFLSYSKRTPEERAIGISVYQALCKLRLRVWFDDQTIDPGDKWVTEIRQGLKASRVMAVVMTASAYESEWVEREVQMAFHLRKAFIVPLVVGELKPDSDLYLWLANLQFIFATAKPTPEELATYAAAVYRCVRTDKRLPPNPLPPQVQVVSPTAGETWHVGQTCHIEWKVAVDPEAKLARIALELWRDGQLVRLLNHSDEQLELTSRYHWSIPADLRSAADYDLRVRAWDDADRVGDASSLGVFRIEALTTSDIAPATTVPVSCPEPEAQSAFLDANENAESTAAVEAVTATDNATDKEPVPPAKSTTMLEPQAPALNTAVLFDPRRISQDDAWKEGIIFGGLVAIGGLALAEVRQLGTVFYARDWNELTLSAFWDQLSWNFFAVLGANWALLLLSGVLAAVLMGYGAYQAVRSDPLASFLKIGAYGLTLGLASGILAAPGPRNPFFHRQFKLDPPSSSIFDQPTKDPTREPSPLGGESLGERMLRETTSFSPDAESSKKDAVNYSLKLAEEDEPTSPGDNKWYKSVVVTGDYGKTFSGLGLGLIVGLLAGLGGHKPPDNALRRKF